MADNDIGHVVFAPYYSYLHLESFALVAKALARDGVRSSVLIMEGASGFDESTRFWRSAHSFAPWHVVSVPIVRYGLPDRGAGVWRMLQFLRNRRALRRALETLRPSVVVVGSDLGGVYIRCLLRLARQLRLKRAIVFTTTVGWGDSTTPPPLPRWQAALLHALGLLDIFSFTGSVPGSYDPGALLCVPGEEHRRRIAAMGGANRMALTGSPISDRWCELRARSDADVALEVRARLGISSELPVILCLGENLADLYGSAYVDHYHRLLRDTVLSLSGDFRCIVKLHPKDEASSRPAFERLFEHPRFQVVGSEVDTSLLVRRSQCVAGHLSGVLFEALAMDVLPIVVTTQRDDTRQLVPSDLRVLEVDSAEALQTRLQQAVSHGVPAAVLAAAESWRQRHSAVPLGTSANAVASALRALSMTTEAADD